MQWISLVSIWSCLIRKNAVTDAESDIYIIKIIPLCMIPAFQGNFMIQKRIKNETV